MEAPALYLPDGDGFVATFLTQGAWDPAHQNGGAVLALLGHCLEDVPTLVPMGLARLTVDLQRPAPLGPRLDLRSTILREGKKLQIVLLELLADDVVFVRATALRLRLADLGDAGAELLPAPAPWDAGMPAPDTCAPLDWAPGAPGFMGGIEMRKAPGTGMWIRLAVPVVAGEETRPTSRMTVAFDFVQLINAEAEDLMGPMTLINPDVNAHVLRPMTGEWTALTGHTRFEVGAGRGLSSAVLSDEQGFYGVASTTQLVEVR